MDKRATEMLGLPIVALEGGKTLAHVEDFIVDPLRKQALAIVISDAGFRKSARAIPFGRITANGPDAMIVPSDKVTLDIERDTVLKQLYNSQTVLNARVMTDGGRELGVITDMTLDDHTGEIKGYDVRATDGSTRWLPVETVLSLGEKMLMVTGTTSALFDAQLAASPQINAGVAGDIAANNGDGNGSIVVFAPSSTANISDTTDVESNKAPSPATMLEDALSGKLDFGDMANIGGTALNTRLLLGIVLLVLGILILVNPALLPLIAGIALIVIGLWIALQNASGAKS